MFATLLLTLAVAILTDAEAADLPSVPLHPKDALGQLLAAAQRPQSAEPLSSLAPADSPVRVADTTVAPPAAAGTPVNADAPRNDRNYYVRPRGYRVVPDTDPPRYVPKDIPRQTIPFVASQGIPFLEHADWLDFGVESRTRFEYRENNLLDTPQTDPGKDYPFLLRNRFFFGVKKIFDPFRFAVEFQDSRWENGLGENTDRQVNEHEPIQLYGELHFDDAFATGKRLYVRAGRMAFELVDRRLIANNEFRNTTNNFQGIRVHYGRPDEPWELDLLWMQPIDRLLYQWDKPVRGLWLYGGTLSWRRWSRYATIQPYWFGLTQNTTEKNPDPDDTYSIQTTGVRAYGIVGESGWDWDVNLVYQFGEWKNDQTQNAWASALEVGYTVGDFSWRPRFSGFFAYGSGDRDPNDRFNNDFNALYGFNQPWSRNDYFSWDNAIQPKARIEMAPRKHILIDMGYGAFWLASARAPWQRANLADPSGRAGNWLGTEYDVRIRYRVWERILLECSYARFNTGAFTKDTGKPLDSNFFYFQLTMSPFGWR